MAVELSEPLAGVTLVTLSNPARRNALDEEDFRTLSALWPRLERSPARCIVLTGRGEAFCSGADLSAGLGALPEIEALISGTFMKARPLSKPLIAAINGVCVAGGLELALACDIRLCADDARLGLPEARWGVFPAGGAVLRLPDEIGHAAAADLLLTGRLIDAAEALRLGLVSRLLPRAAVLPAALETARAIASNSPEAVGAIKAYLGAARRPGASLMDLELRLGRRVRSSPDAVEGASAFLEKRPALYADPELHAALDDGQ